MVLFRYRNYFVCSFLLYGMDYTDMCYFQLENSIDGSIKFRRRKTYALYAIGTTARLAQLLESIYKAKRKTIVSFL